MSANTARPYVEIYPEDEIYHDYANGFIRELEGPVRRQFVLKKYFPGGNGSLIAGVKAAVSTAHDPNKHFLVLMDFDSKEDLSGDAEIDAGKVQNRIDQARELCALSDKVYVLGPFMEAEDLKLELAKVATSIITLRREEEVSNVYFGRLFATPELKCRSEVWGCSQLQFEFVQEQVSRLCELARKVAAVAKSRLSGPRSGAGAD